MESSSSSAKNGFALLYAVLISSLLLAIGATVVSATLKNLVFSSSGRESQFAFYSADTAAECALYYDKVLSAFPTSTPPVNATFPSVVCNGATFAAVPGIPLYQYDPAVPSHAATTTFSVSVAPSVSGNLCATVIVAKRQPNPSDQSTLTTVIDSRGYNTCDASNGRRVERGLRINY